MYRIHYYYNYNAFLVCPTINEADYDDYSTNDPISIKFPSGSAT